MMALVARSRSRWAASTVAILIALLGAVPQLAALEWEGRGLSAIRFDPPVQPLHQKELDEILQLKPGDAVDRVVLREALARLYATGRYEDLQADMTAEGGTVTLTIQTKLSWFVGRVSVSGVTEPPNQGQLVSSTKLQLGSPFALEEVRAASENLRAKLERNGIYDARINPVLDYDESTQQVHADFQVAAGPRARYAEPVITGAAPAEAAALTRTSRWRTILGLLGWKKISETTTLRGAERMRRYYADRERLLSDVELTEMRHDARTNRATPMIKVVPGPTIQVRIEGAKVSKSRLRKLVPVYQEQSADRDLLVEGMRNLTEYFQSEGYFRATVDFNSRESTPGRQEIVYTVDRGPRYKLTNLDFAGNRYFDRGTIRERMAITPATRVRYRNGRFSEALLNGDVASIRELYLSNGFRDVSIAPRVTEHGTGDSQTLQVLVTIKEGEQWRVGEFVLDGVTDTHLEQVRGLFSSHEGEPFSEASMALDRDQVLNYYYNRGYPNVQFDWDVEPLAGAKAVRIHVRVDEGKPRYVRDVLVGGLDKSNPGMVYERLRLQPGDPLSQASIIESQRRLYDLGVFARVDTAVQNPDGEEPNKFLLFQLEEARKYSLNVGLGAEIARIGGGNNFDAPAGSPGFSPRVSFGVSRSNFLGYGHTLAVQTRLSSIQQRELVTYLAPQFKGVEGLALTITGFNDLSRDIRTFTSRRQEGAVQLSKVLSRGNTVQSRFTYRRNTVDANSLNIAPALIPIFSLPVRVGILSGTFIQERRDDPIESRRGYYNSVDIGLASRAFGGSTSYARLLARNSSYYQVYKDVILARSTTFGWQYNLNPLAVAGEGEVELNIREPIPLPERFYSGGSSTHRGFPENQAGPRDLTTGFPVGGAALLINNVELRFPLLGDNLGGALFHDMGNVFSQLNKLTFNWKQPSLVQFDYMVHAAGIGFRYRTPIGPVRFDLAYVPNSPSFFGFRGTREELINGQGEFVMQRLSRFQFHFSLGQTF
jgi:outer membrane protein insertion porin family